VVLVVFAAAFVGAGHRAFGRYDVTPPVVAIAALAAWYRVAAAIDGSLRDAAPAVAMLAGLATIVLVVPRASTRARERLLWGLVLVGLVVAISGWIGFVARHQPLVIGDTCCGGIWRAASTITYANADAAFLVPCILVAVVLCERARSPRVARIAVFVLLLGLAATFSRGGAVALVAGAVALALLGERAAMAHATPAVVGAVVAGAALLPSLRLTDHRHVGLALVGFVAGAALAWSSNGRVIAGLVVVVVLAGLALSGVRGAVAAGGRVVARGRVTVDSPDRSRAFDAAMHLARRHPLAGVGPGQVDLVWSSTNPLAPGTLHVRYAHDEYVQVLAESGGVGFAILVAGLVATAVTVWRRRRGADAVAAAGCIAGLVAVAVHSTTDYLWHIPLIPLTGALLVAAVLPRPEVT
jgi:O-antigen ligase